MDPLLADALLAAYHDAFLDRRRNAGVYSSTLALFTGRRCAASSAFTAVSLNNVSLMVRQRKTDDGLLT